MGISALATRLPRWRGSRAVRQVGRHRALLGILAVFVLLALVYNVSLPLFEAPDERAHFRYVEWLADGQRLPHVEEDLEAVGHEVGQPPLYYSLLALVVAPVNTHDLGQIAPANPYYYESGALNVYYHDLEAEGFPYQFTSLAVRLARFVSTLIGLLTIVSAYGIMRIIAPDYAALAAALVAFNPQFIFISAAVSNDTLLAALSGLTLLLVVRQFARLETSHWLYVALGLLWGFAALTKAGGLGLGAPIALGLLLLCWQRQSWRPLTRGVPLTGVAFLLSSGWWFARNWLLYGDPLAWEALLFANRATVRSEILSLGDTLQYAYTGDLWRSFWIMFGNRVILAPEQFYTFINLFVAAALVGLLLWLLYHSHQQRRYEARLAVLVLVAWSAVTFAALLRWMSQVTATDQGRLLFPTISAVAVLLALGWGTLFQQRRWQNYATIALGGWAVIAPFLLIEPAYSHPPPLPPDFVIPNPTTVSYGEQIELVGYELLTPVLAPGEVLTVDLYWRATAPITENYVVAIHLLDGDGKAAIKWDVAPYDARYPTTLWEPGVTFRDSYTLPPLPDWSTPGRARLLLALYPRSNANEPLPVSQGAVDLDRGYFFTEVKLPLDSRTSYAPQQGTQATFGEQARLFGFDLDNGEGPLKITLYWEAVQPDGRDYTVFIHLLDEEGELVAQADGPPQQGRYPTSIWAAGERLADSHPISLPADLPSGRYRLHAGLYDSQSGQRLPAFSATGEQQPGGSIFLTEIEWVSGSDSPEINIIH